MLCKIGSSLSTNDILNLEPQGYLKKENINHPERGLNWLLLHESNIQSYYFGRHGKIRYINTGWVQLKSQIFNERTYVYVSETWSHQRLNGDGVHK